MSAGLTLLATGAAKLDDRDRDELIRKIREVVQDIENLYRPARAAMHTGNVGTDPVMVALYGARDGLIAAENSILSIALQPAGAAKTSLSAEVDVDIDEMFSPSSQ